MSASSNPSRLIDRTKDAEKTIVMPTPPFPPVVLRLDVLELAGLDPGPMPQTLVAGRPCVVVALAWLDLRDLAARIAKAAGSALTGPDDELHIAARATVDQLEAAIARQRRAELPPAPSH